jgi:hypothetical protein
LVFKQYYSVWIYDNIWILNMQLPQNGALCPHDPPWKCWCILVQHSQAQDAEMCVRGVRGFKFASPGDSVDYPVVVQIQRFGH